MAGVWRYHLGGSYETFRAAFLALKPDTAPSQNTAEAETWLELDWSRLGKALCAAFGLNRKELDLPIPGTRQVGSWSVDAVPVILMIQTERRMFRHAICELALRLHAPFILFAPTSSHMDVACQELLSHARAGFFALDSQVAWTGQGCLQLRKPSRELFAPFTPRPKKTLDEDTTRKAFALVKALDNQKFMNAPSLASVFSLYCIDGLSVTDIARRCLCSRGTIMNRLACIRKKTGADPDEVRRLATPNSYDETSDSRARHIHRKRLIDDSDEVDDSEN